MSQSSYAFGLKVSFREGEAPAEPGLGITVPDPKTVRLEPYRLALPERRPVQPQEQFTF